MRVQVDGTPHTAGYELPLRYDLERGVDDVRVVSALPINTFPAAMRSQVLFGKFAKLVGNGTG